MSFVLVEVGILAVGVIGAGVTAASQISAGKTQKEYQDYNAAVQRQQALQTEHTAEVAAERKKVEGEQLMAKQYALYAQAGVGTSGTPTEVMIGTAGEVAEDAQLIMQKGEFAYQQGMESANISEAEGAAAERGSYGQAGGILLTGLSKTASSASALFAPKPPGNIPLKADAAGYVQGAD
jgi:hypothetical protein